MRSIIMPKLCAALVTTALLAVTSQAQAAPATGLGQLLDTTGRSSVQFDQVQYRGNYQGRRYNSYAGNRGRRNSGRNLALGIGGLIIGGIVLSEAARSEHRRDHGGDWERCASTYRSFESDTGMYTGYDGVRRTCPYLR